MLRSYPSKEVSRKKVATRSSEPERCSSSYKSSGRPSGIGVWEHEDQTGGYPATEYFVGKGGTATLASAETKLSMLLQGTVQQPAKFWW